MISANQIWKASLGTHLWKADVIGTLVQHSCNVNFGCMFLESKLNTQVCKPDLDINFENERGNPISKISWEAHLVIRFPKAEIKDGTPSWGADSESRSGQQRWKSTISGPPPNHVFKTLV